MQRIFMRQIGEYGKTLDQNSRDLKKTRLEPQENSRFESGQSPKKMDDTKQISESSSQLSHFIFTRTEPDSISKPFPVSKRFGFRTLRVQNSEGEFQMSCMEANGNWYTDSKSEVQESLQQQMVFNKLRIPQDRLLNDTHCVNLTFELMMKLQPTMNYRSVRYYQWIWDSMFTLH